ncbi:phage tail protein [Ectothiorhodospira shaposhnikovii]|nr:phage tail protein [Ectothiorhodospira shaposhnikovii]MCG5514138.1 phage tail protein [Ectothiorhodospira shaposhnikovii]
MAGRVDYADLTLRYGMTASTQLWEWMESSIAGNVDRRHVSLIRAVA